MCNMFPSLKLVIFIFLSTNLNTFVIPGVNAAHYKTIAGRDMSRYHSISQKARRSRRGGGRSSSNSHSSSWRRGTRRETVERVECGSEKNASAKLRLYSAADFGVGEYLAEVRLGTPPRKFRLFADTGSDLTWVKCRYGNRSRSKSRSGSKRHRGVFETERSESFKTVACGSRQCSEGLVDLFSLTTCPSPSAPCLYNYSYQANTLSAFGLFGEDLTTLTLTNRRRVKLPGILGCTESTQGSNILDRADGVLGLSYNNKSFGYQAATTYGGGKFSYCLVDHLSGDGVSNYLVFGDHRQRAKIVGSFRYTDLALGVIDSFYAVKVRGISVNDGLLLNIPAPVWDVSGPGGVIIDSGTSLTVLATPAYTAVMKALTKALSPRFPNVLSSDIQPFSYCFNSTGFTRSDAPRLAVHFEDGARFTPHVNSYIIDDRPGLKCIGILEGPGVPYLSIIGNILQQNYFWEFDLFQQKLGFGASTCTNKS